MPSIPPLVAGCFLTGAIAVATGAAWIYTTGRLGPGAIVLCAAISVAASLAVETAVREIRRRRRAPIIRRWTTTRHRKPRLPGGAP
jgi:hypothetical protein